ncbi:MAG: tetratricopeptide repeat protein [Flavobacteriia bacterium]|nr:tetratricopeptide repeat protein [Flavobacteriia bacterium]
MFVIKFLLVLLFYNQFFFAQIDNKKDSIQIVNLLKKSNELRLSGNDHEVFELITTAQKLCKFNHLDELYFISTIELADFHIMIGDYKKANETFKLISPKSNYGAKTHSKFYHRKAFYFNQINRLDSAVFFSNKALKIANENKLTDDKGTIYNELANIYEKQGDLKTALEYYNVACEVYKNNLRYYANTHYNKARIFYKLGNYDKEIALLKENERAISKTDWHKAKCPIYFYLAQAYFKKKDSLNAYKYLHLNAQELNEIQEEEHSTNLNKLIVEYETKEKNAEIIKQKNIISKNNQQ